MPRRTWSLFSFATICLPAPQARIAPRHSSLISIDGFAPSNAGLPLEGFLSFSLEFSSFPDFAGNNSVPNSFSNNLLDNLAALSGTKPHTRVGGNTQDYAIFNASHTEATSGIVNPEKSPDYPTTLTIGPAYFESYSTWPDVKFVHGFNLGRNSTVARRALIDSVSYACQALKDDKLLFWELGNEPDLFKTSAQGPVRPRNWTESDYVAEWHKYTREIRTAVETACPNLATDLSYKYYAPSFAGTSNSLDPLRVWEAGLDNDGDIAIISSHHYISGASSPGVTLQGTLMNHTSTIASVAKHLNSSRLIRDLGIDLPYILGETNSLYNQGRPGLSNTFGAALWGVDFNLYCASENISRVHMHMGTNYRYASWQPIETDLEVKGTKAPYYGHIAVAAFLGKSEDAKVVGLGLARDEEAAYAAYSRDGELQRVIVINMMAYNATDYNSDYATRGPRVLEEYDFQLEVEKYAGRTVEARRLLANGSDAISGITFDGYSYNFELDEGKPILLQNVTRGETVVIDDKGVLKLDVPWSSAAILQL